jgi:hypothetical protein
MDEVTLPTLSSDVIIERFLYQQDEEKDSKNSDSKGSIKDKEEMP